jgi:hypothetical protein
MIHDIEFRWLPWTGFESFLGALPRLQYRVLKHQGPASHLDNPGGTLLWSEWRTVEDPTKNEEGK